MAALTEPWSKRHKAVTRNDRGGLQYNLSNSFAQPTSQVELENEIEWLARERGGDDELLAAYREHPLGYTPNGGSADCRAAVADAIFSACQADDVLITAGGQVAIQTVAFALLDKESHAVVFTPSYQSCQEAPLHAGASVSKVRLTRENNWDIDLTALEDACCAETKLILINQPWNPAGTVVSREKLEGIVEIARRFGAWVLSDEIYRFLEHDAATRLPAVADIYERGVSIGALSKPFGAGGASLGWIACRDAEARQRFTDAMYFGTACPARASEIQAMMVLRARVELLKRNIAIILRNLAVVERFLGENDDLFSYVKPTAGCVMFIECQAARESHFTPPRHRRDVTQVQRAFDLDRARRRARRSGYLHEALLLLHARSGRRRRPVLSHRIRRGEGAGGHRGSGAIRGGEER